MELVVSDLCSKEIVDPSGSLAYLYHDLTTYSSSVQNIIKII